MSLPAKAATTGESGHPFAPTQALHGGGGVLDVHLFLHQPVGHGVVVALNLYMVIELDRGLFPAGQLAGHGRKRLQGEQNQLFRTAG